VEVLETLITAGWVLFSRTQAVPEKIRKMKRELGERGKGRSDLVLSGARSANAFGV